MEFIIVIVMVAMISYHILFSIIVDVTANCIGMIHVRCEILTILIEMN